MECVMPAASNLTSLLSTLSSTGTDALLDRISTVCRNTISASNTCVIFGASRLGKSVLSILHARNIKVIAFCDNNTALHGNLIDGIPVISPTRAALRCDRSFFVVAIYNGSPAVEQLLDLGITRFVRYPALAVHLGLVDDKELYPPDVRFPSPQVILDNTASVASSYDLLSDEQSRTEYTAQINWRCTLDYACLPKPLPASDTYFPSDLFRISPEEVFVDCGAYDGDTIRMFVEKSNGEFKKVYAFEPDLLNFQKLKRYLEGVADGTDSAWLSCRAHAYCQAVGSAIKGIPFKSVGTMESKYDPDSDSYAPCISLDCYKFDPTFIKMDIEGAELDALRGARETIARCRPLLAICAYHRTSHLWEIPQLIHELHSGYRIYLRRYAEDCCGTIYYAVPPERVIA